MRETDTIFALSSGVPPAGVAVIRLSGPGVRQALETLTGSIPRERYASLRQLRAGDDLIDTALVLFFAGPASFTGEDVAEFQVHGGRAVVAALLAALSTLPGFRPAETGEFTRRAFSNQRMDLTQVEGLADLVQAETEAQRRQALRQAEGALGRLYDGWREKIVRARALIEAELDFADEEDIPGSVSDLAWDGLHSLEQEIINHISDRRGERLRDGADIVILGRPNAGKSSLLNAIACREVAIVTPEAGTTRDMIEVRVDLGGYPAILVDTAGLREAAGLVEREGIRRAEERAEKADLILWLSDATAEEDDYSAPDRPGIIRVATKMDLIDSQEKRTSFSDRFDFLVSAETGEGIQELLRFLSEKMSHDIPPPETLLITRARQRSALEACVSALRTALESQHLPLELRAEELRRAGDSLGRLTGRIDVEDLLDVIFRDFCIGK